jgi:hypothetical protein
MRSLLVGLLLALAALVAILGNVGLWVDRTVYDTDGFVSTVDNVLDDEDVQQVIATRFSEELFANADIEVRLREELPEGLAFLALPMARVSQDFLAEATLRLLERQPFEDVRNRALEITHSQLIAIIEDDSGAISAQGGELVLDLRPILEAVAEDVTGREVEIPENIDVPEVDVPEGVEEQLPDQADELLGGIEIPEDAGRFVIDDAAISWAYTIARYGNDIIYAVIGVAVGLFALAIAIAKDRRATLRTAGIVFAVSGVVSLLILLPMRFAIESFAKNDDAAVSVFRILTSEYRWQSLTMIVFGVGVALLAVLFGESRVAVALRSNIRRAPDAPSLVTVIQERQAALRIAGLIGGALLLIAWPNPSTRVYVTVLALIGIYLLALALIVSEAPWAETVRARVRELTSKYVEPGAAAGPSERSVSVWVAAHAGWLRLAGIIVALAALVLWPSLTLATFIMVVALGLVYLAAIDWIAGRGQPSDEPPALAGEEPRSD